MTKAVPLVLCLDPKMHEQFIAEAEAEAARALDARVRAEIEFAVREANDSEVPRVPNKEVGADWHLRRAELMACAGRPVTGRQASSAEEIMHKDPDVLRALAK